MGTRPSVRRKGRTLVSENPQLEQDPPHDPLPSQGTIARGLKPLGLLRYPATDTEIDAFVAATNAESARLQAEHHARAKDNTA